MNIPILSFNNRQGAADMTDWLGYKFHTEDELFYQLAIKVNDKVLVRLAIEKCAPNGLNVANWEWLVWVKRGIALTSIEDRQGICSTLKAAQLSAMSIAVQVLSDVAGGASGVAPPHEYHDHQSARRHSFRRTHRRKVQVHCGNSRKRIQGRESTCLRHWQSA